jgi:predicted nucleic acid-binding protein
MSRRSRSPQFLPALTHLVDTSVLKRLANPQIQELIKPLAEAGNLARPTICDLKGRILSEKRNRMGPIHLRPRGLRNHRIHIQPRQPGPTTQRLLAQRSQRGRKIPDLLIAGAAEASNLTILHYEADFDLVRAVTGQSCHWIDQPGTID